MVEFALVVPLLLLLVIAIADFGRLYVSAVAVESAAREAADYGAFKASYWLVDAGVGTNNPPITTAAMVRRACTAAAGSHLEGYAEPAGTVDHASCTNPTVTCTIGQLGGAEVPCETYPGGVCSVASTDPPCIVHVKVRYDFRMILSFAPLPPTVTIERNSRFAVADLVAP